MFQYSSVSSFTVDWCYSAVAVFQVIVTQVVISLIEFWGSVECDPHLVLVHTSLRLHRAITNPWRVEIVHRSSRRLSSPCSLVRCILIDWLTDWALMACCCLAKVTHTYLGCATTPGPAVLGTNISTEQADPHWQNNLLLLVSVSWAIIGQPGNSIFICRV